MGHPEVVVVTGASAGVGRATAVAFARRGARVALLARGSDGLEAAAKELEAVGGTGLALPTDVAHADQVEAAAEEAERELGPIDVWVNDAMVTVFAPFKAITLEEFLRATQVTYLGAGYGTMAALKRMLLATGVRSCRSARPCPTGPSHYRRRTAARSSPCAASPTRSGPS